MIRRPTGIAAINAAKRECCRGHSFTPKNTYRWTDRRGYRHRQCAECTALLKRRRRQQTRDN